MNDNVLVELDCMLIAHQLFFFFFFIFSISNYAIEDVVDSDSKQTSTRFEDKIAQFIVFLISRRLRYSPVILCMMISKLNYKIMQ